MLICCKLCTEKGAALSDKICLENILQSLVALQHLRGRCVALNCSLINLKASRTTMDARVLSHSYASTSTACVGALPAPFVANLRHTLEGTPLPSHTAVSKGHRSRYRQLWKRRPNQQRALPNEQRVTLLCCKASGRLATYRRHTCRGCCAWPTSGVSVAADTRQ